MICSGGSGERWFKWINLGRNDVVAAAAAGAVRLLLILATATRIATGGKGDERSQGRDSKKNRKLDYFDETRSDSTSS